VHANTAQFRTIASAALERCTAEPSPSASLEPLLLASWVAQQVQVAEATRLFGFASTKPPSAPRNSRGRLSST
jgi:hypothetical protein